MTIEQLIGCLEAFPKDTIIANVGLDDYGSDRGDYYDFYIGEDYGKNKKNYTVGEIIDVLNDSIDKIFQGYKGGDFTMYSDTEVKLGSYGMCGSEIDGVIVKYDYSKGVYVEIKKVKYLEY